MKNTDFAIEMAFRDKKRWSELLRADHDGECTLSVEERKRYHEGISRTNLWLRQHGLKPNGRPL